MSFRIFPLPTYRVIRTRHLALNKIYPIDTSSICIKKKKTSAIGTEGRDEVAVLRWKSREGEHPFPSRGRSITIIDRYISAIIILCKMQIRAPDSRSFPHLIRRILFIVKYSAGWWSTGDLVIIVSRSRRCSVKWAVKYLDIQRGGIGMEEERKEGRNGRSSGKGGCSSLK